MNVNHLFKTIIFPALIISIVLLSSACQMRFTDPRYPDDTKSLWQVIKWRITSDREEWPRWVDNKLKANPAKDLNPDQLNIVFINHASFLIQFSGINIITDPIFSERASPVSWAGPARVRAPALTAADLPKIDIILISHNHYDHMDLPSLKDLVDIHDPLILVPSKNNVHLGDLKTNKIVELEWWQEHDIANTLKITLTPVRHWSARSLWDHNESLWGGFLVQYEKSSRPIKVFFAGDTGYASWFKDIREKFQPIDVSLLPIGAYAPRWFMQSHHMNPAEALQTHHDLGSRYSLGMHFETFQLTDEAFESPRRELAEVMKVKEISPKDFLVPEPGSTYLFQKNSDEIRHLLAD